MGRQNSHRKISKKTRFNLTKYLDACSNILDLSSYLFLDFFKLQMFSLQEGRNRKGRKEIPFSRSFHGPTISASIPQQRGIRNEEPSNSKREASIQNNISRVQSNEQYPGFPFTLYQLLCLGAPMYLNFATWTFN